MRHATLWRQHLLVVRCGSASWRLSGCALCPCQSHLGVPIAGTIAGVCMPLACPSGLPYPLSAWVAQALLSTNPSSCALPPTCLLQTLLRNHGVVCISRTGSDTARLLD